MAEKERKTTSRTIASLAGKALRDPQSNQTTKRLAGAALAHAAGAGKKQK